MEHTHTQKKMHWLEKKQLVAIWRKGKKNTEAKPSQQQNIGGGVG